MRFSFSGITSKMITLLGFNVIAILLASTLGHLGVSVPQMLFWTQHKNRQIIVVLDTQRLLTARLTTAPDLQMLGPPSLSHDGNYIAFDMFQNGAEQGIYIQDKRGQMLYRTPDGIEEQMASLSPDGQQIAFWSRRSSVWQAYIMDTKGHITDQLTTALGQLPYDHPIWSPDGKLLILRFWRPGGDVGYFLADLQAHTLQYLREYIDSGGDLTWSPDSQHLLFRTDRDRNGEIYRYDLQTQSVVNLTNNPATDFQPQWSPDGSRIAFVSNRLGAGSIFIMDSDGGKLNHLQIEGFWRPIWSPDGEQITFITREDGTENIYMMDVNCPTSSCTSPQRIIATSQQNIWLGWLFPA